MPEQPDNYVPTEADIDTVIEEATGKQIKPENLAAGIAFLRQRIERLEEAKAELLDRMDTAAEDSEGTLHDHLIEINRDLATARERLTHCVSQTGRQN